MSLIFPAKSKKSTWLLLRISSCVPLFAQGKILEYSETSRIAQSKMIRRRKRKIAAPAIVCRRVTISMNCKKNLIYFLTLHSFLSDRKPSWKFVILAILLKYEVNQRRMYHDILQIKFINFRGKNIAKIVISVKDKTLPPQHRNSCWP